MATLGTPLLNESDYFNPNQVKCVCDRRAGPSSFRGPPSLIFGNATGRLTREAAAAIPVLIHLGLYAYQGGFLDRFSGMEPGQLEQVEKLEMLRVLEAGYRIQVGVTKDTLIEIDTANRRPSSRPWSRNIFREFFRIIKSRPSQPI